MKSLFWVGVIAVFFIVVSRFGKKSKSHGPSADGQVIEALVRAGSDVSKPHPIDFNFYFNTLEGARTAAEILAKDGFIVKVGESADAGRWSMLAIKTMAPLERQMLAMRRELHDLAAKNGGEYDGWGTAIVH